MSQRPIATQRMTRSRSRSVDLEPVARSVTGARTMQPPTSSMGHTARDVTNSPRSRPYPPAPSHGPSSSPGSKPGRSTSSSTVKQGRRDVADWLSSPRTNATAGPSSQPQPTRTTSKYGPKVIARSEPNISTPQGSNTTGRGSATDPWEIPSSHESDSMDVDVPLDLDLDLGIGPPPAEVLEMLGEEWTPGSGSGAQARGSRVGNGRSDARADHGGGGNVGNGGGGSAGRGGSASTTMGRSGSTVGSAISRTAGSEARAREPRRRLRSSTPDDVFIQVERSSIETTMQPLISYTGTHHYNTSSSTRSSPHPGPVTKEKGKARDLAAPYNRTSRFTKSQAIREEEEEQEQEERRDLLHEIPPATDFARGGDDREGAYLGSLAPKPSPRKSLQMTDKHGRLQPTQAMESLGWPYSAMDQPKPSPRRNGTQGPAKVWSPTITTSEEEDLPSASELIKPFLMKEEQASPATTQMKSGSTSASGLGGKTKPIEIGDTSSESAESVVIVPPTTIKRRSQPPSAPPFASPGPTPRSPPPTTRKDPSYPYAPPPQTPMRQYPASDTAQSTTPATDRARAARQHLVDADRARRSMSILSAAGSPGKMNPRPLNSAGLNALLGLAQGSQAASRRVIKGSLPSILPPTMSAGAGSRRPKPIRRKRSLGIVDGSDATSIPSNWTATATASTRTHSYVEQKIEVRSVQPPQQRSIPQPAWTSSATSSPLSSVPGSPPDLKRKRASVDINDPVQTSDCEEGLQSLFDIERADPQGSRHRRAIEAMAEVAAAMEGKRLTAAAAEEEKLAESRLFIDFNEDFFTVEVPIAPIVEALLPSTDIGLTAAPAAQVVPVTVTELCLPPAPMATDAGPSRSEDLMRKLMARLDAERKEAERGRDSAKGLHMHKDQDEEASEDEDDLLALPDLATIAPRVVAVRDTPVKRRSQQRKAALSKNTDRAAQMTFSKLSKEIAREQSFQRAIAIVEQRELSPAGGSDSGSEDSSNPSEPAASDSEGELDSEAHRLQTRLQQFAECHGDLSKIAAAAPPAKIRRQKGKGAPSFWTYVQSESAEATSSEDMANFWQSACSGSLVDHDRLLAGIAGLKGVANRYEATDRFLGMLASWLGAGRQVEVGELAKAAQNIIMLEYQYRSQEGLASSVAAAIAAVSRRVTSGFAEALLTGLPPFWTHTHSLRGIYLFKACFSDAKLSLPQEIARVALVIPAVRDPHELPYGLWTRTVQAIHQILGRAAVDSPEECQKSSLELDLVSIILADVRAIVVACLAGQIPTEAACGDAGERYRSVSAMFAQIEAGLVGVQNRIGVLSNKKALEPEGRLHVKAGNLARRIRLQSTYFLASHAPPKKPVRQGKLAFVKAETMDSGATGDMT